MLERPRLMARHKQWNATASIPIASGSLYHGMGREQGGERRVSGMEIAKVWDWCGNQEGRGKM
jgi:hypothetical protein